MNQSLHLTLGICPILARRKDEKQVENIKAHQTCFRSLFLAKEDEYPLRSSHGKAIHSTDKKNNPMQARWLRIDSAETTDQHFCESLTDAET
ncbi:MAG: hypothetical protein VX481_00235 [Cyanobacteriota bacterium]|nr:hypothetical protein [Cyanobacteriota bacterium]